MNYHVVVWDPRGEFAEGSIVQGEQAHQIQTYGAETLPVMPDLFRHHGIGGYMRRGWGSGWPLDHSVPKMTCPLSLYIPGNIGATQTATEPSRDALVHWCARLEPASKLVKSFTGVFRFASDPSQPCANFCGFAEQWDPRPIAELGPVDAHGGWVLRGRAKFRPTAEGVFAFAFYAAAVDLRVTWAAVSLTATG
jgi:hypothetical protein